MKVNSRNRLPVIKFLAKCPQDSIFFNRASLPFTFCKQHLNESFILCACFACMHVCVCVPVCMCAQVLVNCIQQPLDNAVSLTAPKQ